TRRSADLPAAVNDPLRIAEQDVAGRRHVTELAEALDEPRAGDRGGAAAAEDDRTLRQVLAGDLQRVQQGGDGDDRRAVLIVVEDRDAETLEARLDLEAAWRRDVLEVDAAEDRRDRAHDRNDLVDVLRRQANRKRIDAGEFLE